MDSENAEAEEKLGRRVSWAAATSPEVMGMARVRLGSGCEMCESLFGDGGRRRCAFSDTGVAAREGLLKIFILDEDSFFIVTGGALALGIGGGGGKDCGGGGCGIACGGGGMLTGGEVSPR